MGYFDDLKKDYTPSMDVGRMSSAGPAPSGIGFSDNGTFTDPPGVFKEAGGMFAVDGSKQQAKDIAMALRQGRPSAINPMTPPVRSPLLDSHVQMNKRGGWIGGDMSLSPFLQDDGSGLHAMLSRLGML